MIRINFAYNTRHLSLLSDTMPVNKTSACVFVSQCDKMTPVPSCIIQRLTPQKLYSYSIISSSVWSSYLYLHWYFWFCIAVRVVFRLVNTSLFAKWCIQSYDTGFMFHPKENTASSYGPIQTSTPSICLLRYLPDNILMALIYYYFCLLGVKFVNMALFKALLLLVICGPLFGLISNQVFHERFTQFAVSMHRLVFDNEDRSITQSDIQSRLWNPETNMIILAFSVKCIPFKPIWKRNSSGNFILFRLNYCHVYQPLQTGVWTGKRIYWILATNNYK
jgi:hypothetical protein